jgi:hypothetical protein
MYLSLCEKEMPLASIWSTLDTSASARVASGFGGVSVMCVRVCGHGRVSAVRTRWRGRTQGHGVNVGRRTDCSVSDGSEDGGADEAKEDEAADDGIVYSDLLVVGVPLRCSPLQVREQAPNKPGDEASDTREHERVWR